MQEFDISFDELYKAFSTSRPNKAEGSDEIN